MQEIAEPLDAWRRTGHGYAITARPKNDALRVTISYSKSSISDSGVVEYFTATRRITHGELGSKILMELGFPIIDVTMLSYKKLKLFIDLPLIAMPPMSPRKPTLFRKLRRHEYAPLNYFGKLARRLGAKTYNIP